MMLFRCLSGCRWGRGGGWCGARVWVLVAGVSWLVVLVVPQAAVSRIVRAMVSAAVLLRAMGSLLS